MFTWKVKTLTGAILLSGMCGANAAIYSDLTGPYDVTLNSGAYAWQNTLNNADVVDSSTSVGTHQHYNTTSPVIVVEETPPEVGVPGIGEVYSVTTSTIHDHTVETDSASINFNNSIAGTLTTPESFTLTGSIISNEMFMYDDWLYFDMGFNVGFDSGYSSGSVDGTLSFLIGNTPDNWSYTYQTTFDSIFDGMSFGDGQYLDFNQPVYFSAIYDIAGTSGVPFDLTNLYLNVNTSDSTDIAYTLVESTENRTLLSTYEIPALPAPVPVPAALWLFGSGLIGLAGIARRKKS